MSAQNDVILVWLNDTLYTRRSAITGALPKGFRTDDSILFAKDFRRSNYDQAFVSDKLRDMVKNICNDWDWQRYSERRSLTLEANQSLFFPFYVHLLHTKQIGRWVDGVLQNEIMLYPLSGSFESTDFSLSASNDHTIPIMLHMPSAAWLMAVLNFPPHAFANTIIIPSHKFPKYISELVPLTQRYRSLTQWMAQAKRYLVPHGPGVKFKPGNLLRWEFDPHFYDYMCRNNLDLAGDDLFTKRFRQLTMDFYKKDVLGNAARIAAITNLFTKFFNTLGDK